MADIFNEDGKYNKTDWESGDRITANKLNRIEMAIEQINDNDNERHTEADGRLNGLEAGLTETKDKVDNIDMAYKTADTVLTNRVNNVETSYKAADTTLNNRVNSVETAYKTSETNLTNKFNNLSTAYQNAVSNLTAKFNSLETAYKAADTKMTNNINNLDAAYKAADTTLQNNIDALDTAYKAADVEIQNSIPTKISQLEYDINDNLISNGRFTGAKPNMVGTQLESWVMLGDIQTYRISPYTDTDNALVLQFMKEGFSGEIHQHINDYRLSPGDDITLSFYCDWEPNVSDPEYVLKFQLDNVDVESIYGFCIQGNQSYTFTVPDIEFDTILVGFKSELGLKENSGGSYVNMYLNHVKLEVGDKATAWCEKQHNIATRQYVDNQNCCIHVANGINGTNGYVKMCSIKVIESYADSPMVIKFTRRRDILPKEVIIKFNTTDNEDPGIDRVFIRGRSGEVAYVHKSATSIYDLWIEKNEPYDYIGLLDVQMSKYQADKVEITYTNEHSNNLPDGYISPQPYNGFYISEHGDYWNNGTPLVRDDGVMDIGKSIDFHDPANSTEDKSGRIAIYETTLYTDSHWAPWEMGGGDLGNTSYRWRYLYLQNQPNVSSDRSMKENITYIKNETAKSNSTDEVVTYEDMYNFVKNDLELASYNFIGQEKQCVNFIAQDLLYNIDGSDNKVGQMIIDPVAPPTEEEIEEAKAKLEDGQEYSYPTLNYDMGMYISVLAGALKEALNKIDKLEDEIKELKNK